MPGKRVWLTNAAQPLAWRYLGGHGRPPTPHHSLMV